MLAYSSLQGNISSRRPVVGRPQQQQQKSWQVVTGAKQMANKYRLPKLPVPKNQATTSGVKLPNKPSSHDAVYTRYGFFEIMHSASNSSLPELDSSDHRSYTTRSVFPGPAFTQAVVTPILISTQGPVDASEHHVREFSRQRPDFKRSKTSCTTAVFSAFGSTLPRSPTVLGGWQALQKLQQQQQQKQQPLKADTGSSFDTNEKPVEWVIKPLRRFQSDKKGQQRNQGPFSRELQVHARAPQAWLRMKWGGGSRPMV